MAMSPSILTSTDPYESLCKLLESSKIDLENLNKGLQDKLEELEQKSHLLKTAYKKTYEFVLQKSIDESYEKLYKYYADNCDTVCSLLEAANATKQETLAALQESLIRNRESNQQLEEKQAQVIKYEGSKTIETLQQQKLSLQDNLEKLELELGAIKTNLSSILELQEHYRDEANDEIVSNELCHLQEQRKEQEKKMQHLKEQCSMREAQLAQYNDVEKQQQTIWGKETELVARTNLRLKEQVEKLQNIISTRFPSDTSDLRSLTLSELQHELAINSLQHSIVENAISQLSLRGRKLLHALGTMIRNCSPNARIATAIIKILDNLFENNDMVTKNDFTIDQLKNDLDADEEREALEELVRLGLFAYSLLII
eukprot:jgi/Galph1/4406/GphlegSOOS_G3090.1